MKQDASMVTKGLDCCLRTGIPNCKECPYTDICYHDEPCKTLLFHASSIIHEQQAEIELLKEHRKIKEQLEELQIMENSKIKECDSYCDWDAKNYHQGRFDAYSIALAGFNQKN